MSRCRADPRTEAPREKSMGRLQSKALETMGLDADVEPAKVRRRYAELVKRFHPDANGGDRSLEDRLQAVIRAYETLKTTGLT